MTGAYGELHQPLLNEPKTTLTLSALNKRGHDDDADFVENFMKITKQQRAIYRPQLIDYEDTNWRRASKTTIKAKKHKNKN